MGPLIVKAIVSIVLSQEGVDPEVPTSSRDGSCSPRAGGLSGISSQCVVDFVWLAKRRASSVKEDCEDKGKNILLLCIRVETVDTVKWDELGLWGLVRGQSRSERMCRRQFSKVKSLCVQAHDKDRYKAE